MIAFILAAGLGLGGTVAPDLVVAEHSQPLPAQHVYWDGNTVILSEMIVPRLGMPSMIEAVFLNWYAKHIRRENEDFHMAYNRLVKVRCRHLSICEADLRDTNASDWNIRHVHRRKMANDVNGALLHKSA